METNCITLMNGKNLVLYPKTEAVSTCTDFSLFAQNAHLLLGNSELIFSDSRLFMSPIDMNCGLAYSGKFAPTTLGAYLEWWINHPASHDKDGNLVLHLAGSPLSGANSCTSVEPDGARHSVVLPNFSGAWHSFLEIGQRYRDCMKNYQAYPLEKVIEIVTAKGVSREVVGLQAENKKLQRQLDNDRKHIESLKQHLQSKTDEYLKAILAPHIEDARTLYGLYEEAAEFAEVGLNEQRRIRKEAKLKLQKGEIKQEEYIAIKHSTAEVINEIHYRLEDWWMQHFIRLYKENARFFTLQDIKKFMKR